MKVPDIATPSEANAGSAKPISEIPETGATGPELTDAVLTNW